MREWQQTRDSAYVMPYAVYYQSIWAVRDLARMEEKLKEINVFCKCKFQKGADKNGESCISVLEKVAGCPAGLPRRC